ncbi:magnesium chelatase [Lampropedia puyangensis]|uniref:Magnesium chelatase n=1 Tax=Lampropedia puyangensis TaxID=1330072 RepID=A0A4S8FEQ1_9BURK|nr:ATP-binding protein [Lampropedia puyangensis]THU05355.1 magnesium chelatase [Lampropedia puyangensis]
MEQALFPFSAIKGQPDMQLALVLAAIDPAIGGVLIEGPSGTAKSTAARALSELLAPHSPFVTLPLGASLEHVAGSLDLNSAIQGHAVEFAPGLLAKAHGGVLYVDEINLLPDAIVDVLLDAAASGVHTVERDGISHSHPARFVLIGTMNPEEGQLRPQLLDRLGLNVQLGNVTEPHLRQHIVKTRLAFDANPHAFRLQYANANAALAERLHAARTGLDQWSTQPDGGWNDAVHTAVSQGCIDAAVNGLRADMVWLRAARAAALWQGDSETTTTHVAQVKTLVLAHRSHGHANTQPAQSSTAQAATTPPAPPQRQPSHTTSTAHAGQTASEQQAPNPDALGATAPPDWGAMAPEPVRLQRIPSHAPLLTSAAPREPLKNV